MSHGRRNPFKAVNDPICAGAERAQEEAGRVLGGLCRVRTGRWRGANPASMFTANEDVVLMDGGMGHLLKERAALVPGLPFEQQFLAGALANLRAPGIVKDVHKEYLEAGSRVVTTNNFAVTPHSLGKIGKGGQLLELTQAAATCAREAVNESGTPAKVAGCLPPLLESYQVNDLPSLPEMTSTYKQIANALAPHVDLLLCETLSTLQEAVTAATAAMDTGLPVWVSFTLEDSLQCHLRSGEQMSEAAKALQSLVPVHALLLNCCAPQAITAALPQLKAAAYQDVLVGCYANGFQDTTTQWLTGAKDLLPAVNAGDFDDHGIITPTAYSAAAQSWVALGATVVGGCCGIGPNHIKAIARMLPR